MSKYTSITIFTKKGNLLHYMEKFPVITDRMAMEYGKEREIQLVLSTRYEYSSNGTKLMCKISCPVNPLPVKGEFEAPSYGVICRWLQLHGWTKKGTMSKRFFE